MKLPQSYHNWTSLLGTIIALMSLFLIIVIFIISSIFDSAGSYLGLFIYIVLPAFLVLGLIMIPVGMISRIRKLKRMTDEKKKRWPEINLNIRQHRNAFTIFIVSTIVFLFLSTIGSYEAFHYTESIEFCGTLCHEVMHPEYITYQHSSHSRVACVECHVGAGADWYVRSKLSGLYQVYSVLFKKYPRPIGVPLHNLRPARETCEHCHWPEKFYPQNIRVQKHYLADTDNTPWDIHMKMKVGSEHSATGLEEGIHWHIHPRVKIEYIPEYQDREVIPWVRYIDLETGDTSIYMDEEFPPEEELIQTGELRSMDCIDCHNRPSHEFFAPQFFIDQALSAGTIPRELPDIKYLAMEILYAFYSSTDSAMILIEQQVNEYYSMMYKELVDSVPEIIEKAIQGIKSEYKQNMFPEMNAQWDHYPNHISHIKSNGCFRCHDNRHVSPSGEKISNDCNLCHTIVGQGSPGNFMAVGIRDSLEFIHPVDIGESWKEYQCMECHRSLYE